MRLSIISAFGTTVLGVALLLPVAGTAGEAEARQLHQENCTRCHDTSVYTRADRKVDSPTALHKQVRMCEQNLGLTWFDEQVDAVTALLNGSFYKFDQ